MCLRHLIEVQWCPDHCEFPLQCEIRKTKDAHSCSIGADKDLIFKHYGCYNLFLIDIQCSDKGQVRLVKHINVRLVIINEEIVPTYDGGVLVGLLGEIEGRVLESCVHCIHCYLLGQVLGRL